jgi:hypothetical protein
MSQLITYAFFDPPQVLDSSVTPFNIPASSGLPLQVILNSGTVTGVGMSYNDSTGAMIGVYTGAAGLEKLLFIIGNGKTSIESAKILPGSRISLRAMANVPITVGLLAAALVTEW